MKFLEMSDTHLEFLRVSELELPAGNSDLTLILAGDITVGYYEIREVLKDAASKYKHVIFVPGNHEYYHGRYFSLNEKLEELNREVDNLHILNCSIVEIEGVKIGGAVMWGDPTGLEDTLGDTMYIRDMTTELMVELNQKETEWVKENSANVDIMVTHFCPSPSLGNPNFPITPITKYFCPDVADDLCGTPKFWVFGHTHHSLDTVKNGTRYLSNQMGYPGEQITTKKIEVKECLSGS